MKNVFIVNKASCTGKAEAVWNEVKEFLEGRGVNYEVHFTQKALDATVFAREATSRGEDVLLFVMGGDGTLNEALNGIEDFEHTYYCPLPAGSANDFVRGIGLEGSAVQICQRALEGAGERLLDIGLVEYDGGYRRFGVSAGIGVDAFVCLQALDSKLKRFLNVFHMGKATYGLLTVGDIFTMPLSDATIIADGREKKLTGVIFAAAMNCPAEGGGIPMVPYARADSGILTAFVAHNLSRVKCLSLLPWLVAGKHENKKGFEFVDFTEMKISMEKPMCVHADGEHLGFLENITFRCLAKTLKLRGF